MLADKSRIRDCLLCESDRNHSCEAQRNTYRRPVQSCRLGPACGWNPVLPTSSMNPRTAIRIERERGVGVIGLSGCVSSSLIGSLDCVGSMFSDMGIIILRFINCHCERSGRSNLFK